MAAKFVLFVAILVPACLDDYRKREASDVYWMLLGAVGLAFMVWDSLDAISLQRIGVTVGTAFILFYFLWQKEEDPVRPSVFVIVTGLLFAVSALRGWDDVFVRTSMVVPLATAALVAMYYMGVVKGGADVKCLIVTAIVFQTYPEFFGLPMISVSESALSVIFPFIVAVFFMAALFSMLSLPPIIIRNLVRGDRKMPQMLSGYVIPLQKAREKHVWPMENVIEGVHVFTSAPQDDPGVYDALESIGRDRVWVTPKIPFLIPILAAVVFVAIIGNPFFLLA